MGCHEGKLSHEGIARILAVGRDEELTDAAGAENREAERALRQLLSAPVSIVLADTWRVPEASSATPNDVGTLREMLMDSSLDIGTAKTIKDGAKRECRRRGDEKKAKHAACLAVYFAAIANALVFHKEKISSYSYLELETAFTKMAESPWMAPELVPLFCRARDVYKRKAKRDA